jgi:RNA polymerase sigma factor (sigma-70 family)
MLSAAQHNLVEMNIPLARAIAHRVWKATTGYDRNEMISDALLGLIMAAQRWPSYCAEHGYDAYSEGSFSWFKTYASRRIKGQIIDAMRASDVATRKERGLVKKIKAGGVDLSIAWDYVSAETIAKQAGMNPQDVKIAIRALVRAPLPLDSIAENAPQPSVSAEQSASELALCAIVVDEIKSMSQKQQEVVAMAYYLDMTDDEIMREFPEFQHSVGVVELRYWIRSWREDAARRILAALRAALVE